MALSSEKKKESTEEKRGGELLFCGATSWDIIGRHKGGLDGNLLSPTRLKPLVGINIRFVAFGCASCHCVALDVEGRCYTLGPDILLKFLKINKSESGQNGK
ncbi:unnamed protein product [Brassica oleracea var. botrytis]|uniref:(rape) hypothetical protein n=1 Tax=Brassica napus TaxID=3708 RepID=A0A816KSE6_BRANA|nr:unnamed protein product [Brassica napus]